MEINTKYTGLKMIILVECFLIFLLPIFVIALDFPVPATVTVNSYIIISLNQGWNLISIPLVLEDNSIETVLVDIMDKVIVVHSFDQGAKTYDPQLPEFSDLQEIDYMHGYWIKVSEPVELSVSGSVPDNKIINLVKDWNLVSYLCSETKNVDYVFAGIMDEVIVINGFENEAKTYDPQLPEFSDLQEVKPNFGYWIKMTKTSILNYNNVC